MKNVKIIWGYISLVVTFIMVANYAVYLIEKISKEYGVSLMMSGFIVTILFYFLGIGLYFSCKKKDDL